MTTAPFVDLILRTTCRLGRPAAAVILAAALMTGCGSSDSPAGPDDDTDDTPTVQLVNVTAADGATSVQVGSTLQLTAQVVDDRGNTMPDQTPVWTTSAESVASVSQTGLVTAHEQGSVRITAAAGGRTGTYDLTVTPSPCQTAGEIAISQTVTGVLSSIDCALSDGSYADRWRLQVGTQTRLRVDMVSTAVDAYLVILDASGNTVAENDDGGDGTDSRVDHEFAPGTYIIMATSFTAQETGSYTLSVTELPSSAACTTVSDISMSQTVTAALASSDCVLSDGSFFDVWRLQLSAATNVRVVMTSTAFDAYLYLVDANGTVLAEDDDSFGNGNARIEATLGAGTWFFRASSFSSGSTGDYQISALPFSNIRAEPATVAPRPDKGVKAWR